MIIYLIRNLVNGKIYIGKTVSGQPEMYIRQCLKKAIDGSRDKPRFYNAVRKYGISNFEFVTLLECMDDQELKNWEIALIAAFGSRNPQIGYNISEGGDGPPSPKGLKRSVAHRLKIGAALKLAHAANPSSWSVVRARAFGSSWKENISIAVATANKRRKGLPGHKHSLATRLKMKESHLNLHAQGAH